MDNWCQEVAWDRYPVVYDLILRSLLLKNKTFFSFFKPFDTILGVYVAYVNKQLRVATQVSGIKDNVTLLKIEIQVPLKNSLHRLFDAKCFCRRHCRCWWRCCYRCWWRRCRWWCKSKCRCCLRRHARIRFSCWNIFNGYVCSHLVDITDKAVHCKTCA